MVAEDTAWENHNTGRLQYLGKEGGGLLSMSGVLDRSGRKCVDSEGSLKLG